MSRLLRVTAKRRAFFIKLSLLLLALLMPCIVVWAEEGKQRTLRVAFPELEGISQTDENGDRHGIVVDYLNEIAKYTGWNYEYIDTDGETLLQEFVDGKYDLMGGTYYMSSLEAYVAYPDYDTGFTKSVILARRDDDSIRNGDWKSMSGKIIGVYERAQENIRRLNEFLRMNGIDCTIKQYGNDQMVNGNLYSHLIRGEVDMLLGNSGDYTDEFRVVAKFDSQPQYIVTTPDNREVLDGLNMALKNIQDSNPNFAEERYKANFPDSGKEIIFLNEEEREYIRQKRTVSVSVVRDWHPLYCMESENKLHNGLVPDMLSKVQEYTGLEFTYVYADNYAEALALVQENKVDMLGAFLGTELESSRLGLALTKPYATLNEIIVRNKSVSYPSEGLVGAMLEGREMPPKLKASKVVYFPTATAALKAVNSGEVDFFYGLSSKIEPEIQSHHYMNVVPNILTDSKNDMSFAMVRPAEAHLLTIMNKAINSMSSEEKDAVVTQNLISVGVNRLSIIELIYANPLMFVSISAGVFLLLAILLMLAARFRVHSAKMQSNLEKAEAASRAKSEFLSRMSHEIRTPMNAIVGLSDLACMMDDVPENVKENLTKIRSSSHYLLSLISDILDVSRIESGKMTIACEPFSISRLIEELKSMMTEDAKRRQLEFVVEEKVEDDILIGDAVRLKQVLTNLLSNAFKFTPAGGKVLVRVAQTERAKDTATYHFRVIDNGVGISEKNQRRIFEAFEQVGTNYSKSQGTGLGLAISKTIVSMMGGELKLVSEPKKGSEFYFTAPFPIGAMEEESENVEKDLYMDGKCILLAEDNDLNAEIAEELLGMQGAKVIRAENGKIALELFEKSGPGEFTAVLMDLQMPEMDGLEACRAIRKLDRPDAVKIPIIAMTANTFKEDADAAKAAGMNGFVTKPVDVEYLYRVLRKNLDWN